MYSKQGFLRIHSCVNHALLDLGEAPFTANEITTTARNSDQEIVQR